MTRTLLAAALALSLPVSAGQQPAQAEENPLENMPEAKYGGYLLELSDQEMHPICARHKLTLDALTDALTKNIAGIDRTTSGRMLATLDKEAMDKWGAHYLSLTSITSNHCLDHGWVAPDKELWRLCGLGVC